MLTKAVTLRHSLCYGKKFISSSAVCNFRQRRSQIDPGISRRTALFDKDDPMKRELEDEEDLAQIDSDFSKMEELGRDFNRERHQRKKLTDQKITIKKFFSGPKPPSMLTWAERKQIIKLHEEDPEQWNLDTLAESFPAPRETISKILKNKWTPESLQKMKKKDKNVRENWKRLEEGTLEAEPALLEHLKKFLHRREDYLASLSSSDYTELIEPPKTTEYRWNEGKMSSILESYEQKLKSIEKKQQILLEAEKNSEGDENKLILGENELNNYKEEQSKLHTFIESREAIERFEKVKDSSPADLKDDLFQRLSSDSNDSIRDHGQLHVPSSGMSFGSSRMKKNLHATYTEFASVGKKTWEAPVTKNGEKTRNGQHINSRLAKLAGYTETDSFNQDYKPHKGKKSVTFGDEPETPPMTSRKQISDETNNNINSTVDKRAHKKLNEEKTCDEIEKKRENNIRSTENQSNSISGAYKSKFNKKLHHISNEEVAVFENSKSNFNLEQDKKYASEFMKYAEERSEYNTSPYQFSYEDNFDDKASALVDQKVYSSPANIPNTSLYDKELETIEKEIRLNKLNKHEGTEPSKECETVDSSTNIHMDSEYIQRTVEYTASDSNSTHFKDETELDNFEGETRSNASKSEDVRERKAPFKYDIEEDAKQFEVEAQSIDGTYFWDSGKNIAQVTSSLPVSPKDPQAKKMVPSDEKYPEKIRIPKEKRGSGLTFRVNDCFYDDDGIFLYRVPGLIAKKSDSGEPQEANK